MPGDRGPVRVAECRATIDRLKSDNEQLKEELQLERKNAKAYDSVSAQAQIAKLQDTGDMYTRKIELEKRRIEELDKQMETMHKKIWEQRQKMGGVNASRENNQAIAKQIRILENRLDQALKKYVGTHNFHNFTSKGRGKKVNSATDPSAMRYITEMSCR